MKLILGDREFEPADAERVTVYQCGPTVYAEPHIGNLRSAVVWDVLHRVLARIYGKQQVQFVRNYTDVDDKIMDAARERGDSLDIAAITEPAIVAYEAATRALHVMEPSLKPRVSQSIPDIVSFIERLIQSGHAYESQGHVLFDRAKYPEFYLNTAMDPASLQENSWASYKRAPSDFVLWKPSADDQPGWTSPWGTGRPGWHIECSAMIRKFLGETIDLHVGGNDLKFPHHECECAQSQAANGVPLARHWAHNGMLNWVYDGAKLVRGINGARPGKMSKSLGNVVTLDMLIGEGYSPEAIRYYFLTAHYSQPLVFTYSRDRLQAAESAMKTLQRAMRKVGPMHADYSYLGPLLDDLNTPKAIAKLHELANAIFANRAHDEEFAQFISLADVMGLHENYEMVHDDETVKLLQLRSAARANKDFATADRLRADLEAMGVEVTDAPLSRL